jgi:SAM-dependent methyltransferase
VLEHVPNPEQALREMRRVLKPNGLMLLNPAWMCSPLSANGYHVRPFKDFGLGGKIVKATMPIHNSPLFELFYTVPSRTIRRLSYRLSGKPTTFHYRPLTPNYDEYWEPDSDAVNTLDLYETYLWFTSRGDECLNCGENMFWEDAIPLVIRVKPEHGVAKSGDTAR